MLQASGRSGAVTPIGGGPLAGGLSFKLGQLVRLQFRVNDEFLATQIVEIYGYQPVPMSTTKQEGQSQDWKKVDDDTLYRFRKRAVAFNVLGVWSAPSGHLAIHHSSLSSTRYGQPNMSTGHARFSEVYTTKELQIQKPNAPRELYTVPRGTRGTIEKFTTRSGKQSDGRHDPSQNYYVVIFQVKIAYWKVSECDRGEKWPYFQALTSREKAEYDRKVLPADSFV